ncbi:MAG: PaaI family thioesterase [Gammaproteobacteria bacterium]|nr:PaaI family thioesterase [Gammaproteobacteria bacterium]
MLDSSANRCFVCGPGNNIGLKVRFQLDDENICHAEWTSSAEYVGYEGVTHGGIIFCLLDDVMANLLFLRGEICVTAKADVRFHEPLGLDEKIKLRGNLVKRRGKLAIIEGSAVRDSDDALIASSTAHFVVQPVTEIANRS